MPESAASEAERSAVEVAIEKCEKTAMQWLKKQTKTIDNDVKEKYKTSPPQTCGENSCFVAKSLLRRVAKECNFLLTCLPAFKDHCLCHFEPIRKRFFTEQHYPCFSRMGFTRPRRTNDRLSANIFCFRQSPGSQKSSHRNCSLPESSVRHGL